MRLSQNSNRTIGQPNKISNDNYLNVQQDILETFIDRGQLRKLAEPTITATGKRIPGLKLDLPRQLALMQALVRFANVAAGNTFTTAELYPRVLAALGSLAERSPRFVTTSQNSAQIASSPSFLDPAAINSCRRIFNLPDLPEAVRPRLCAAYRRRSQPGHSDTRLDPQKRSSSIASTSASSTMSTPSFTPSASNRMTSRQTRTKSTSRPQ
jgi:hypothetical protein